MVWLSGGRTNNSMQRTALAPPLMLGVRHWNVRHLADWM